MKTIGLNRPFHLETDFRKFVGRDKEIRLLKKSILDEKKKIIGISGNNATGKTSLWKVFFGKYKEEFNNKVEVIYSHQYHREEFPKIDESISIIVIEDFSFEFSKNLINKVKSYIKKYSKKQFILVGAIREIIEKISPDVHIHLESLKDIHSIQLLLSQLEKKIPEKDLVKITKLTNGHPYLLNLVGQYLNSDNYNIDEIFKLINESINQKGLFKKTGGIILETSPEFLQITDDIRIVNKSILDKIRLKPEDVYSLTPRQFEEMVAELMTKRGYKVDLTKATRDGGKDLIIANHTDIGNFIYYVECKKYAPTNPIGVNLVRELVGTISADRVTAGIMITSSYFSPDAIQFSEKFRHQLSLIDFIKLKEWVKDCS